MMDRDGGPPPRTHSQRKSDLQKTNSHLQRVKHFHDQDAHHYTRMRYHSGSCEGLAYVTRRELVLGLLNTALAGNPSPHILDIGCGPGILTEKLLETGGLVFSTDLSEEMIRHAKQKALQNAKAANAFFLVNDASNLPLATDRMDIALCIGVLYYVKDHRAVLSEIRRVLKPGGQAIVQINKTKWPNLYKKLVPVYRWVKANMTGKKYDGLDFEFNYFDYPTFIREVERQGFKIAELAHFDFRLPFLDVFVPKFSVRLGRLMYRHRNKPFIRHFAFGLLIRLSAQ